MGRERRLRGGAEVRAARRRREQVGDVREGRVVLPEVEPVELLGRDEPAVVGGEQEPHLVRRGADDGGGVRGQIHRDPEVGVGGPQLEAQPRGIDAQERLSLRSGLGQDAKPPCRDRGLPCRHVVGCLDRNPPSG